MKKRPRSWQRSLPNSGTLRRFTEEQVEVGMDPELTGTQTLVELETMDGKSLTARCEVPKGAPANPLSRGETEGKFRRGASRQLSPMHAESVLQMVSHLEELSSIDALMKVLARSGA
jgi:2-methylcitrate dehydratase PrpD